MAGTTLGKDDDPFAGFEYLYQSDSDARRAGEKSTRSGAGTGSDAGDTADDAAGTSSSPRPAAGTRPELRPARQPAALEAGPAAAIGPVVEAGAEREQAGGFRPRRAVSVGVLLALVAGLGAWAVLGTGGEKEGQAGSTTQREAPAAVEPEAAPVSPPPASPVASPVDSPPASPATEKTPAQASPSASARAEPSTTPARTGGSERSTAGSGTAGDSLPSLVVTADDLTLAGGATLATDHRGYTGAGFVTGMDDVGAAAGWRVEVPTAGYYRLSVRYSNARGTDQRLIERNLSVSANGVWFGQIRMPVIGSWDFWGTTWRMVRLTEGTNRIVLSCAPADTCHVNLDTFRLSRMS